MANFELVEKPASMFKVIPLDALRLSPRNARKTGAVDVSDLVASIGAHGLQQNLVVTEQQDGLYDVECGGRRLRALQLLSEEGRWPGDRLVHCAVLAPTADANEISAAENLIRKDMHPADEFVAFKAMADVPGTTIDDIAARFGRKALFVEQRLKLANVAPSIMAQLKEDKITVAQVIALSITEDHAEQERVWKTAVMQGEWAQDPARLRRELLTKELDVSTSELAKYLGVADYEKGGGVARRDLFSEQIYLPDAKLARQLAKEKLDKSAKKVREEGWAWVEVRLDFGYADKAKFYEDHGTHKDGKRVWSDHVKSYSGAVVSLNEYQGKVEITRGLARPADKKKADASKPTKKSATSGTAAAPKPAKKQGELSFAQVQRLQGQRTAVLRVELATKPRIALAALAADLARSELLSTTDWTDAGNSIVHIAGDRHIANQNIRQGIEEHPASEQLEKLEGEWIKRLKPAKGDLFGWLLKEPESTTHELLGYLAAQSIVAGENVDKKTDAGAKFAAAAGIDMVKHWKPTLEWLQAQPRGVIVAAVAEAVGKKQAAEVEKLKKGDAATRAEQLLAGTGWIPKPLRAPATKKAKA